MRMRSVVLVVVLAALAIGGVVWWLSRPSRISLVTPDAARRDAAAQVVRPPSQPPVPAEQVTAKQEDDERAQMMASAGELGLAKDETAKLLSALAVMQAGRRELFADLAAHKIAVEAVSKRLGELRDQMNASFEKDLGKDRAAIVQEHLRAAHGFEPAPAPQ